MTLIEDFFRELDSLWPAPESSASPRPTLHIIGSAALLLQADYYRATKDSDVLETIDLDDTTKGLLRRLAGKDTPLHKRRRLYVDIVDNGLPFLAQTPHWHPLAALNASLSHLQLVTLDIVDVTVSKLKRFSANDRADIDAMINKDLVPHARFIERFRAAVDVFAYDARADDLPAFVRRLHQIERDTFNVPESTIDLPSWIGP